MALGVPILKHFRVYCEPLLEPSHQDHSNEVNNLFLWKCVKAN